MTACKSCNMHIARCKGFNSKAWSQDLNKVQPVAPAERIAKGATEEQRFLWSNVENHRNYQKEFAPEESSGIL